MNNTLILDCRYCDYVVSKWLKTVRIIFKYTCPDIKIFDNINTIYISSDSLSISSGSGTSAISNITGFYKMTNIKMQSGNTENTFYFDCDDIIDISEVQFNNILRLKKFNKINECNRV